MIRTLIVDDEPLARRNLAVLLRGDREVVVIGECASGADAVTEIQRSKPDLVFLDVQMPECDGFDVLERLGTESPPAIVFVTAYDHYALKAFETGALDYLLKPFDDARFALTLARAKDRIEQRKRVPTKTKRLVIKGTGQVWFVNVSDIDWIEAADYYACLHVGTKTHLLRRRMLELERELDYDMFCRIHRSSIVNLDRVLRLEIGMDGEYEVLLVDGTKLQLSRRYRQQLQSRLGAGKSPRT